MDLAGRMVVFHDVFRVRVNCEHNVPPGEDCGESPGYNRVLIVLADLPCFIRMGVEEVDAG